MVRSVVSSFPNKRAVKLFLGGRLEDPADQCRPDPAASLRLWLGSARRSGRLCFEGANVPPAEQDPREPRTPLVELRGWRELGAASVDRRTAGAQRVDRSGAAVT